MTGGGGRAFPWGGEKAGGLQSKINCKGKMTLLRTTTKKGENKKR